MLYVTNVVIVDWLDIQILIEVTTQIKESLLLIMSSFRFKGRFLGETESKSTQHYPPWKHIALCRLLSRCAGSCLVKRFLDDLNLDESESQLITVYRGSQVAIAYTKDAKLQSKLKYIETKYHFVSDIMAKKNVTLDIYQHMI